MELSLVHSILEIVYIGIALLLATYGVNTFLMVSYYLRHRNQNPPLPSLAETPPITIQLPIYNELYVVERLIDAACALDYPADKLQIQVLDDSTDGTTAIAQARVAYQRRRGVNIGLIHRAERPGFKAGALQQGLATATGEYIAIFDADFVPPPDFLRRTIPYFLTRPTLGLIQTRWGHLNAEYSPLTRAEAIALDGHFVVEQTARNRAGFFMNFNGTAGVWRRACIDTAGGWQGDTLSEDLDLSYRAQLLGWEFLFLPHVVAPAEIPAQINAFKRQQFRWAKGSLQCALKLGPQLLTAPISRKQRWQAFVHLTNYLAHPLMLLLLFITLPLMLLAGNGYPIPALRTNLIYLTFISIGPPLMYAVAQRETYPNWRQRLRYLPLLILLGSGIAWNTTLAFWEVVTRQGNAFRRTPKFNLAGQCGEWRRNPYALHLGREAWGELFLTCYSLATVCIALYYRNFYALPFMLMYLLGFGYVFFLTLYHSSKTAPQG